MNENQMSETQKALLAQIKENLNEDYYWSLNFLIQAIYNLWRTDAQNEMIPDDLSIKIEDKLTINNNSMPSWNDIVNEVKTILTNINYN